MAWAIFEICDHKLASFKEEHLPWALLFWPTWPAVVDRTLFSDLRGF